MWGVGGDGEAPGTVAARPRRSGATSRKRPRTLRDEIVVAAVVLVWLLFT